MDKKKTPRKRMKDYIVEVADEIDGFILVEALNAESACKKAERLGYEVYYAQLIDDKNSTKSSKR